MIDENGTMGTMGGIRRGARRRKALCLPGALTVVLALALASALPPVAGAQDGRDGSIDPLTRQFPLDEGPGRGASPARGTGQGAPRPSGGAPPFVIIDRPGDSAGEGGLSIGILAAVVLGLCLALGLVALALKTSPRTSDAFRPSFRSRRERNVPEHAASAPVSRALPSSGALRSARRRSNRAAQARRGAVLAALLLTAGAGGVGLAILVSGQGGP